MEQTNALARGFAIASVVCAALSVCGGFTAFAAIICGMIALILIRTQPDPYKGKRTTMLLAIVGTVIGLVMLVIMFPFLVFFFSPA